MINVVFTQNLTIDRSTKQETDEILIQTSMVSIKLQYKFKHKVSSLPDHCNYIHPLSQHKFRLYVGYTMEHHK